MPVGVSPPPTPHITNPAVPHNFTQTTAVTRRVAEITRCLQSLAPPPTAASFAASKAVIAQTLKLLPLSFEAVWPSQSVFLSEHESVFAECVLDACNDILLEIYTPVRWCGIGSVRILPFLKKFVRQSLFNNPSFAAC